jgi:peroxiredoxin
MALTYTVDKPLGSKAPDFRLLDVVTGGHLSLEDVRGAKGTLLMFICNHCPYVVHVREKLVELAKEFSDKGISFVAISSNDVSTHPQDGPQAMKELAESDSFPFPYLYDETQVVAKAYEAACTPDFFLFDENDLSVYRGRLDGSSPGRPDPVTGEELRSAKECFIQGAPPLTVQNPSMGCNIKWKPGNEPAYYN